MHTQISQTAGYRCIALAVLFTVCMHVQLFQAQGSLAQLSGNGILDVPGDPAVAEQPYVGVLKQPEFLHAAAPLHVQGTSFAIQLIVGAALVLFGFCLHAILVLHKQEAHQGSYKKGKRPKGAMRRRTLEVYWLETTK